MMSQEDINAYCNELVRQIWDAENAGNSELAAKLRAKLDTMIQELDAASSAQEGN